MNPDCEAEGKEVTKRFGPLTILERVNLPINEKQVTTIIGPSGSGKSVLLKHIVGLLKLDEGTILFRGKPLHRMEKKEMNYTLMDGINSEMTTQPRKKSSISLS